MNKHYAYNVNYGTQGGVRVTSKVTGGIPDRQIKDASNNSADETGEQCDQDPFEKRPDQIFY